MEELKMILEVVSAAGEGAYTIAILYFARQFLQVILTFSGLMILLYFAFKLMDGAIKTHSMAIRICEAFGPPIPCYKSDWIGLCNKVTNFERERHHN